MTAIASDSTAVSNVPIQPRASNRWAVHGPSEVVDPAFEWSDRSWTGSRLRDYRFYQTLLRIRGDYAALAEAERDSYDVTALPGSRVLMVHYRHPEPGLLLLLAFGSRRVRAKVPLPPGIWRKRHDSADRKWRGPGSAVAARLHAAGEVRLTLNRRSALLFERTH